MHEIDTDLMNIFSLTILAGLQKLLGRFKFSIQKYFITTSYLKKIIFFFRYSSWICSNRKESNEKRNSSKHCYNILDQRILRSTKSSKLSVSRKWSSISERTLHLRFSVQSIRAHHRAESRNQRHNCHCFSVTFAIHNRIPFPQSSSVDRHWPRSRSRFRSDGAGAKDLPCPKHIKTLIRNASHENQNSTTLPAVLFSHFKVQLLLGTFGGDHHHGIYWQCGRFVSELN